MSTALPRFDPPPDGFQPPADKPGRVLQLCLGWLGALCGCGRRREQGPGGGEAQKPGPLERAPSTKPQASCAA